MSYRKRSGKVKVPSFDPEPSGRFAGRVLAETRTPGALIGRVALWVWLEDLSQHPFTKDLDIAIGRTSMPLVKTWLDRQNLRTRDLSIGGVNVQYPESGVNVDFIDRTNKQYGDLGLLFSEAINAAVASGTTATFCEYEIPVVPPEYLVAMKIVTQERDDDTDAMRLLEHVDMDLDEIRTIVERHLGPFMLAKLESLLRAIGHSGAKPRGRG